MPHIFYSKNYVAHFKGNASKEQNAEAHMQKRILVAVPKNIYKNLLHVIAIGQTLQYKLKSPLHMNL